MENIIRSCDRWTCSGGVSGAKDLLLPENSGAGGAAEAATEPFATIKGRRVQGVRRRYGQILRPSRADSSERYHMFTFLVLKDDGTEIE